MRQTQSRVGPGLPAEHARVLAAAIVLALPPRIRHDSSTDIEQRVRDGARRAVPELAADAGLGSAASLYTALVAPHPERAWAPLQPAVLVEAVTRALVASPDDVLWRDYLALLAAAEGTRPRAASGDLVVLGPPATCPEGLKVFRAALATFHAHRRHRA